MNKTKLACTFWSEIGMHKSNCDFFRNIDCYKYWSCFSIAFLSLCNSCCVWIQIETVFNFRHRFKLQSQLVTIYTFRKLNYDSESCVIRNVHTSYVRIIFYLQFIRHFISILYTYILQNYNTILCSADFFLLTFYTTLILK